MFLLRVISFEDSQNNINFWDPNFQADDDNIHIWPLEIYINDLQQLLQILNEDYFNPARLDTIIGLEPNQFYSEILCTKNNVPSGYLVKNIANTEVVAI